MSRRTYKGLKIGFDADECAGPLASTNALKTISKKPNHPSPNKPSSRTNRFQVLSFGASEGEAEDEAEDGEDDDDAEVEDETDDYESISNELNGYSSRNGDVEADDSYWSLTP